MRFWRERRLRAVVMLVAVLGLFVLAASMHPVVATPVQRSGPHLRGATTAALNCWVPQNYFACTLQSIDQSVTSEMTQLWQVDFFLATPAASTYANPTVITFHTLISQAVDVLLVLVVLLGGLLVLYESVVGGSTHHLARHIPNLLLAYLGVYLSLFFCQAVIDLNNALSDPFRATIKTAGFLSLIAPIITQNSVFLLMLLLVYLGVLLIVIGQMLYRLALVNLLIIVGPLGMLCFALPQTRQFAHWWMNTFVATVITQFLQLIALALGLTLMAVVAVHDPNLQTVFDLLWALATLYLTFKIPSLLKSIGQTASGLTGDLAGGVTGLVSLATLAVSGGASAAAGAGAKPQQSYATSPATGS